LYRYSVRAHFIFVGKKPLTYTGGSAASDCGGPFSRKTDGAELQKPSNRKFFLSFIYNDLRHFPRKKSPKFRIKRAGRSKYGGRLLFAPGKERRHEYKN
jgi:hypothetical protein